MAQILQNLDQEWSAVVRSPEAQRAMMRWTSTHPALTGHSNLNDILTTRRNPACSGPVLAALATLAPDDDIAARTLLQAMIPGLLRLARSTGNDDRAAIDELISLAWERIRTYPADRRGSVAANILLDVRKQYRRHRRIEAPTSLDQHGEELDPGGSTEDLVLGNLLIAELIQAQRNGVMSSPVLVAILRTRLCGDRLAEVAAEQDISPRLLWHRRWRAENRLRQLAFAG